MEAVVEKVWKAEDDEKDVAEEEAEEEEAAAAAVHLIMLTFMVKGKTRLEKQLSQWGTHTMRGSHRESQVESRSRSGSSGPTVIIINDDF